MKMDKNAMEFNKDVQALEDFSKESFLMDFYFSMYRESYYGSLGVV